jgi:septum formation protein
VRGVTVAGVKEIILASESRYRRDLIGRLGLDVRCVAADYDEEREKDALGPVDPITLVRTLARGKACSLAARAPDALVIGSDQTVELDGESLGKPHTPERAIAQLARLAGRTHRIHTAVAIHHARAGRTEEWLDTHTLTLRALSREEIEDYVRRDSPLDCAGSYKIEGIGIALFDRIEGTDFTGVIGLPLTGVVALLARFGERVFARG